MKFFGFVLISVGLAILLYVAINAIGENNQIRSPIPDEKGVKVIFVTPTQ